MLRKLILFLLFLASLSGYASHLRSGEISYQPVPGKVNTYLITFTIYTNAGPSATADLNILTPNVNLGDGTIITTLARQNGPAGTVLGKACAHVGILVTPVIRKNIYSIEHTYPGPGTYIISTAPSARNTGILNLANGQAMYIESMLTIANGLTPISSPELSFPPYDPGGCMNTVYKINPGAIDPDGDELRFLLVKCKTTGGVDISSYKYPDQLDPTGNTTFKMDPRSGLITWNMPTIQGEYNIAFRIEKYRNGVLVGYVLRDMQITTSPCSNNPPVIDPIPNICVPAGSTISYKVTSNDVDGDTLTFSTTGMPYDVAFSPAKYTPDSAGPYVGHTSGTFYWKTDPVHFTKNAYQVYYRVSDSHKGGSLTDIVSNFITITASAVKNVTATVFQRGFNVKWDQSVYPQATGYKIYRKTGISPFVTDSCTTGVPLNSGFTLVGTVNDPTKLSYIDLDNGKGLPSGYSYCYVVTALFDGGAESAPSDPACGLLMYPFINVLQDTLINCQWSTITIDTTIIQFINANQQTVYNWTSSPALQLINPNQQDVSVKLLTTGLQTIKIIATSGVYIDSAKIYIQVNPIPSPKIKLYDLGGWPDSVMFYNRSLYSVRAEWLFPDGTQSSKMDSVLFTFDTNGYYRIYLKVYNSLGCPDTTSILYRVVMKGVAMPNAFEPENPSDKLNSFRPLAVGLETYFLGVWDLWGNLVWSSDKLIDTSPAEGWNGTDSKGKKMPGQNYIWRMTATYIDGTIWKGVKDHFGKFHKEGTFNLLR
jgi:hypothetical protein